MKRSKGNKIFELYSILSKSAVIGLKFYLNDLAQKFFKSKFINNYAFQENHNFSSSPFSFSSVQVKKSKFAFSPAVLLIFPPSRERNPAT